MSVDRRSIHLPDAREAPEPEVEHRSAREVLAQARVLVDPALRAAVDTLPDSMRHLAGYHFGWWDEHGAPVQADAGKAIRPALALLAAEAVGAAPADALPAAVAVELVHNFTLLHDDVMDGDHTRRHRPTAWSVFGLGPAILAGDALLTLAFDVLAAGGGLPDNRVVARVLSAAVLAVQDGQAADLAFERRAEVGLAECVRMAEGKTGALLGCATALGAHYGGATPVRVDHLRSFGERLGLAFQLTDDLLGIWGDPVSTGKPVYSDLENRKKSLPVVAAMATDTPAAHELRGLYRRDTLSAADLVHAADLIDHAGGRAWTRARADELLTEARAHLLAAHPVPRAAAELTALADLAVRRDH
ncbi:family 2 encapsulin nanocompartment cargo protein polyprenyl transferase [Actinokineospora enzanensis]|uniref:family 2 encapsulin nanocompartment cargo protein polyprenyl transferase n=1 Tax=Actinokineospora enzanensis TaxID=155975 RepID=UPI00037C2FDB|nr:family 2 encapsulin nanocompartment cargo protein polyprenyl transferase [Actinokineospora enzanensis]